MSDDSIERLTAIVVSGARALATPSQAVQDALATLEAASSNVRTAADTPDMVAWQTAVNQWQHALQGVSQAALLGGIGTVDGLMTAIVRDRLPQIPAIRDLIPAVTFESRDGLHASAELGPVLATIDGPSAWARFDSGPGQLQEVLLGVLPPTALGLAIGTGPVSGGGSLDYQDHRFSGSFGLTLGAIQISAFGLLEPVGSDFSLVLLLAARFTPGIQVGLGFAISRVGGLIGINRQANLDVLEVRFKSGAAVDALFADDPVRNAPAVLATLRDLFVAAAGFSVVGPTIEITWLEIDTFAFFHFDLGVFIELPGPSGVIIVGSAQAELPGPGTPLLYLRLDLLGLIDGPRQLVAFDATLVNSRALGIFRVTGDAAFRLSWGDRPYIILTLGGFFPGFNPEPAALPPLARIALTFDCDLNPALYMNFEAYLAVTTNTLQVGGRLDAGLKAGPVSATGFMSLDALIQFSPFHFTVDFSAGFAIRVSGHTFAGIECSGTIDGPGPFVIFASLSIEILFFEISWSQTFTLGDAAEPPPPIPSLVDALAPELGHLANLRARNAEDAQVALGPLDGGGLALLAPRGDLIWTQKLVPLDLPVDRFQGAPLGSSRQVALQVTMPAAGAAVKERLPRPTELFSPGSFRNLSKSEALNQKPFEALEAGVAIGFDVLQPPIVDLPVVFDQFFNRGRAKPVDLIALAGVFVPLGGALLTTIAGRHAAPSVTDRSPVFTVSEEPWAVRSGPQVEAQTSQTAAHTAASATSPIDRQRVAGPSADVFTLEDV